MVNMLVPRSTVGAIRSGRAPTAGNQRVRSAVTGISDSFIESRCFRDVIGSLGQVDPWVQTLAPSGRLARGFARIRFERSQSRLQSIFSRMNAAYIRNDIFGNFSQVVPAWERLFAQLRLLNGPRLKIEPTFERRRKVSCWLMKSLGHTFYLDDQKSNR